MNPTPRLFIKNLNLFDPEGIQVLKDVSFTVCGGEILGIAGIAGSGQRELLETIAMPEDHALVVLRSAAQNPYTKAAGSSVTQYTIIYNNTERTMKAWSFQDFSKNFCYDITGKPIL